MSLLNNDRKTNLLFRQYVGVANALLPVNSTFTNEPLKNINYVFNSEVQNQPVPTELPANLRIEQLDACANIVSDSSFNLAAYGYPQLTFFKQISLDPVPGAASQVWMKYIDPSANPLTNQVNNLLTGMIPFKYDDINVGAAPNNPSYLPVVYRNFAVPPATNFLNVGGLNNTPLYWIQNPANGLIQFYATTTVLNNNNIQDIQSGGVQDSAKAPKLSFYKYTGTYGVGGGGGGVSGEVAGTVGVADYSNNTYGLVQDISEIYFDTDSGLDLSFSGGNRVIVTNTSVADTSAIENSINNLNRMILPDGYVDVSGNDYDMCGNETVRTYFTYNRQNIFIGYDNLPVLDGSAVDHSFDPSHGGITYELDVSGKAFISAGLNVSGDLNVSGHTTLVDVSAQNLDLSGDLNVLGHTSLVDVSAQNLDLSGDLNVLGHTSLVDVSAQNLDLSGDLNVLGHTSLVDVSAQNLDLSGDLNVLGHTSLVDVSAQNLDLSGDLNVLGDTNIDGSLTVLGNSYLYGDFSMNGGQILWIGDATDNSGAPSWGQVQQAIADSSGGGSLWTQNGSDIYYNTGNVGIGITNPSKILEVSGDVLVNGTLDICCNNIIDVSNIFFCNNTAILGSTSGILTISADIDMSMNQILTIADATDNSGVPSWGQVQQAIADSSGGGSLWTQNGSDIYYNTGNVGIGTAAPAQKLDVNGSANIAENAFVSISPTQSTITADKNLYTRNTNLIDTLKISYETFYNNIWNPMINANSTGTYTSLSTGLTQTISIPNPGKSLSVPTFASAWGPSVIPIAYLDINQNYVPFPFDPAGGQTFQTPYRPDIANTTAYFTVKFSEPYDASDVGFPPIDWKTATLYQQFSGSMKSGCAAITEQTITFMVGYIDSYQLSAPNGSSNDFRNPKPFIKVISTNIGNLKCLTGVTAIPDLLNPANPPVPANIDDLTQNMKYYGFDIDTPKIGGICRIIVAESCPGLPADIAIQNKAWVLLEQQWNVEPWQQAAGVDNSPILAGLVDKHVISVRMYSNNLGDLNSSRGPPFINQYNTDWQLVTEKQLQQNGIYSWEKFVLPMGGYATPQVFNTPTSPPVGDISFTLMVGGTPCPNPITGSLDIEPYPTILDGANLWEVWLNLKDWPYGITTTEEVFENDVDICGNLLINGSTDAQAITATDITCNNLDALNSIDVGASQELTITQSNITSVTPSTNFFTGLTHNANNFYYLVNNPGIGSGFVVNLNETNDDHMFRIMNGSNFSTDKVFTVGGSGVTTTRDIRPNVDLCYNIGFDLGPGAGPNNRIRYKQLHIGDISCSFDLDVCGTLNVSDISATNITVSNHLTVPDISTTNIDVSNNLNVDGLITGVAGTTFVEYRNFSADISAVSFDGGATNGPSWYCIATCEGAQDNARGLFIIDDDTSGIREQIIFYAGTSYARGNFINVLAHNWYMSSGPLTTNLKIDVSGTLPTPTSPAIYAGANLYIYRNNSATPPDVRVRLYQNGREANSGGRWVLTSTPIVDLSSTAVDLDLTFNPNNSRANAISSLDTLFYGDASFNGSVSLSANTTIQNFNLIGNLESTSDTLNVASPPYVWGTNYIQQVDPLNVNLVGSYKQIRTAFYNSGSINNIITFSPPNNLSGSYFGVQPPCSGGGELFEIGTPLVWDLPPANYDATFNTFTIPDLVERTLMRIEFNIDIFFPNVNDAPFPDPPNYIDRVYVVKFWVGKDVGANPPVEGSGSGPTAFLLSAFSPAYFGTNSTEPTYSHSACITLLGGDNTLANADFRTNDRFYFTAQASGTAGLFARAQNFRIKITWEAVN